MLYRFTSTLALILLCACSTRPTDHDADTGVQEVGRGGTGGVGGASGTGGAAQVAHGTGGAGLVPGDASTSDRTDGSVHDAGVARDGDVDVDAHEDAGVPSEGGWLLAVRGSDGKPAVVNGTAVAADGSVYVVGQFTGSATIESTDGADAVVTTAGAAAAAFVARYDMAGVLQWTLTIGGGDVFGKALAVLSDGGIVVTGRGGPMILFGQASGGPQMVMTSEDFSGPFLARYTAAGEFSWALGSGSDGGFGEALSVTANDDAIYMVGLARGDAKLGSVSGPGASVAGGNNGAGFVARYTLAGALEWATQIMDGESLIDAVVVTDAAVFVGGQFRFTSTFESVVGASVTRSSSNAYEEAFVARYGHDGALAWVNQIGSIPATASWSQIWGLAIDGDGQLAVGGVGVGSGGTNDITFRSTSGDPTILHEGGGFLATYSGAGVLARILRLGERPNAIAVPDSAFATGSYLYSDNFTSASGAMQILPAPDQNYDGYLVEFDSDGEIESLQAIGPAGDQTPTSLVANAAALHIAGTFDTRIELDGRSLAGVAEIQTGFVARVPR